MSSKSRKEGNGDMSEFQLNVPYIQLLSDTGYNARIQFLLHLDDFDVTFNKKVERFKYNKIKMYLSDENYVVQADGLKIQINISEPVAAALNVRLNKLTRYGASQSKSLMYRPSSTPERLRTSSQKTSSPVVITSNPNDVVYSSPFKAPRHVQLNSPERMDVTTPDTVNNSARKPGPLFSKENEGSNPTQSTSTGNKRRNNQSVGKQLQDQPKMSALPNLLKPRSNNNDFNLFSPQPVKTKQSSKSHEIQQPQRYSSPPSSNYSYGSGVKEIREKPSIFSAVSSRTTNQRGGSGIRGWEQDDDLSLRNSGNKNTRRGRDRSDSVTDNDNDDDPIESFDDDDLPQKNTLVNYFTASGTASGATADTLRNVYGRNKVPLSREGGRGGESMVAILNRAEKERREGGPSKQFNTLLSSYNFNRDLELSDSAGIASRQFYGATTGSGSSTSITKLKGGIRNLGNSCYMSAIIQAILASSQFMSAIESPFWSRLPVFLKTQSMTISQEEVSLKVQQNTQTMHKSVVSTGSDYLSAIQCEDKENVNSQNSLTPPASQTDLQYVVPSHTSTFKSQTECIENNNSECIKYDKYSCLRELCEIARLRHKLLNEKSSGSSIVSLFDSSYNFSDSLDISKLKSAINHHSSKFKGYLQQDAHEFLNDFITALHDEMSSYLRRYLHCIAQYQDIMTATSNSASDNVNNDKSSNNCSICEEQELLQACAESIAMHDVITTSTTSFTSPMAEGNISSNVTTHESVGSVEGRENEHKRKLLQSEIDAGIERLICKRVKVGALDSITEQQQLPQTNPASVTPTLTSQEWLKQFNDKGDITLSMDALLPTSMHFESEVEMQFRCKACNHVRPSKTETYRDFSLELTPEGDSSQHSDSGGGELRLESLFTQFFADEERELRCEECVARKKRENRSSAAVSASLSDEGKVVMSSTLRTLPNILVLHLKRFRYDVSSNAFVKMNYPVVFPSELNTSNCDVLRQFQSVSEVGTGVKKVKATVVKRQEKLNILWRSDPESLLFDNKAMQLVDIASGNDNSISESIKQWTNDSSSGGSESVKYKLCAVVRHLGESAVAGHYICDVLDDGLKHSASKNVTDIISDKLKGSQIAKWLRYNDSLVTPLSEGSVLEERDTPYIFFYSKQ